MERGEGEGTMGKMIFEATLATHSKPTLKVSQISHYCRRDCHVLISLLFILGGFLSRI